MKKIIQLVCIIMALVIFFAVPASAAGISTKSNAYIAAYDASFGLTMSSYQFKVWFEIVGTDTMDEIGVSEITIKRRSSENDDWSTIKTFLPEECPNMIAYNTSGHVSYVTYTAPPGYYYKAIVRFYAKKGNGFGVSYDYPEFYFG